MRTFALPLLLVLGLILSLIWDLVPAFSQPDQQFIAGNVIVCDHRTPIRQPPAGGFPIVISEPGSYFFTSHITGESGSRGILIAADDVTLDMNGFTLTGVPGSIDGIFTPDPQEGTTIRNGVVRSWGSSGINIFNSTGALVEDCKLISNGSAGANMGFYSLIRDTVSLGNDGLGITAQRGSVVNCIASNNGGDGIRAFDSLILGCSGADNLGVAIDKPGSTCAHAHGTGGCP